MGINCQAATSTKGRGTKWLRHSLIVTAAAAVLNSVAMPSDAVITHSGRTIKDPWGTTVVFRGVEFNHGQDSSTHIDEFAKTGGNYMRMLFWAAGGTVDNAQIEARIKDGIRNHMMVSIGFAGQPGANNTERTQWVVNWYVANKSWLMKYEQHLVAHAVGEQDNGISDADWRSNVNGWVSQLRNAGYTCPIDVLCTDGGRNINCALNNGQAVNDSDPQHNLIVGWQAYWPWNQAATLNGWQA